MTPRQADVLKLAAHAFSNVRIATLLGCTEKAVERALEQVYADMGIQGDPSLSPRVRAVVVYLGAQQ